MLSSSSCAGEKFSSNTWVSRGDQRGKMALGNPVIQRKIMALSEMLRKEDDKAQKEKEILDHIQKIQNDDAYKIDLEFPSKCSWYNVSHGLKFSEELAGNLVVLDFFTYCCINCMHILPDLHRLEQEFNSDGIVVIGVHSAKFPNEKDSKNILDAIIRYDITHPVINDTDIVLWERLSVSCWPTLVIIGPNQHLLHYIVGEGHATELNLFVETAVHYFKQTGSLSVDTISLELEKNKISSSVLKYPGKVAANLQFNRFYIADSSNHRIVVTDDTGEIKSVYGHGSPGFRDGSVGEAEFNTPQGIAYHQDSLYVADAGNHVIRKVVDILQCLLLQRMAFRYICSQN